MPSFVFRADLLQAVGTRRWTGSPRLSGVRRRVLALAHDLGYAPPAAEGVRAEVKAGLSFAFPALDSKAVDELVTKHLRSMYRVGLGWALLRALDGDGLHAFVRSRTTARDEELLREVARGDRPVILVSAHYGLPVLGCLHAALTLRGMRSITTFYDDPAVNPATAGYDEVLDRAGLGIECVNVSPRAVLAAVRALRRGAVLTMQPDVFDNRRGDADLVPSFGTLAYVMRGTAYLALKTNAVVMPAFAYPVPGGRYEVRYLPPLPTAVTGDQGLDQYHLTAAIQASIDDQIRRAPEHWLYWQTFTSRTLAPLRLAEGSPVAWRRLFFEFLDKQRRAMPVLSEVHRAMADAEDSTEAQA